MEEDQERWRRIRRHGGGSGEMEEDQERWRRIRRDGGGSGEMEEEDDIEGTGLFSSMGYSSPTLLIKQVRRTAPAVPTLAYARLHPLVTSHTLNDSALPCPHFPRASGTQPL